MTARRVLRTGLGCAGLLTLAGSLAWWWASYGEVYSYDYLSLRQAGLCLFGDSEICRLATSLCRGRHAGFPVTYSAVALWLGLTFLFASLIAGERAAPPSAPRGTRQAR